MYGRLNNEKSVIDHNSRDRTGRDAAMLTPDNARLHPVSVGADRMSGICTTKSATMRNRYVAALMTKIWAVLTPQMASNAAMAGPTTRLPFNCVEFRLMAPARSRRSTSMGTLAWNAGALRALATPMEVWVRKSAQMGPSTLTIAANTNENTSCTHCMKSRYRWRLKRLAMMPPGIARRRRGPSCANTSRLTILADPVRSSM